MSTIESTFDLHDMREHVAAGDLEAFGAMLADDVGAAVQHRGRRGRRALVDDAPDDVLGEHGAEPGGVARGDELAQVVEVEGGLDGGHCRASGQVVAGAGRGARRAASPASAASTGSAPASSSVERAPMALTSTPPPASATSSAPLRSPL